MAQAGPVVMGRFLVGWPPLHHAEPLSQIFTDAQFGNLTIPDAVTRVYWALLGRPPDPSGYNFYANGLANQYGFNENKAVGLMAMVNDFLAGAAPELVKG